MCCPEFAPLPKSQGDHVPQDSTESERQLAVHPVLRFHGPARRRHQRRELLPHADWLLRCVRRDLHLQKQGRLQHSLATKRAIFTLGSRSSCGYRCGVGHASLVTTSPSVRHATMHMDHSDTVACCGLPKVPECVNLQKHLLRVRYNGA